MTNDSIDDRLRESLAALSKPVETGEEPSLVHRALEEVESGSQRSRAHGSAASASVSRWHRPVSRGVVPLLVASLALAFTVPYFSTTLSGSRSRARQLQALQEQRAAAEREADFFAQESVGGQVATGRDLAARSAAAPQTAMAKAAEAGALADAGSDSARAEQPRIILRTGSCEIRVEDVEIARHTVESLIRPDLGEYIENASVALDQSNPSATITVRIDSARFDEFMAALSGVGTVRSVSVDASDATDQIVDLEARIRNERRVEEEVLRLLENRQDAPLEDIVRVRRELSDVRGSIERMEAHRQSILGRAELSTVRITLVGPEPRLEPGADDSPSFSQRIKTAASDGWRTCTDTVVWVIQVLVSGLVWWIGGAVIIWIAVRHHRWTSSWR